jgi:hypothetical protein
MESLLFNLNPFITLRIEQKKNIFNFCFSLKLILTNNFRMKLANKIQKGEPFCSLESTGTA